MKGGSSIRGEDIAGLLFWKKTFFAVGFKEVQRGLLSERKGKAIPCKGTKDRKDTGTNSGKSGMRDLEAENIRSRAESTGRCVKVETIKEIRQHSAHDAFIKVHSQAHT